LTTEMGESSAKVSGTSAENVSVEDKVKVSIHFTKIEALREGDGVFSEIRYPIDMNVGEAIRRLDNSAIIHFTIRVSTDPKIAVMEVKGEAIIRGPVEGLHRLTLPEGNSPPPIWKEIYREAMVAVSLLSKFFEIPAPPTI